MRIVSLFLLVFLFFSAPFSLQESLASADVPSGDAFKEEDFIPFEDPFDDERNPRAVADPLEVLNRAFFWINDRLYSCLIMPVLRSFQSFPADIRRGASSLANKAGSPFRSNGTQFQIRFRDAGSEVGRFVYAAFLGIGGLADSEVSARVAERIENLGHFLEERKIGPGIYLVLPVVGPSTFRDGIGRLADLYLDALPCLEGEERGGGATLASHLNLYQKIKEQALDPYLVIRDAYSQRLEAEARNRFSQASRAEESGKG